MALSGFDIDACVAASALAGVGVLHYVPVDEVDASSFVEAVQASNYNQQAGYGVADWYAMPYAIGSGSWTEDQQDDEQGNTFRHTINRLLPADTAATRGELSAMRHRRFLLRIQKNGAIYLAGSIEQPLRFQSRFESGSEGGDTRGHRISFSGISLRKIPAYVPVF